MQLLQWRQVTADLFTIVIVKGTCIYLLRSLPELECGGTGGGVVPLEGSKGGGGLLAAPRGGGRGGGDPDEYCLEVSDNTKILNILDI
jgi:hypothetical protein